MNVKKLAKVITDKKFIAAAVITAVTVVFIAMQRKDPKLVIEVEIDPTSITDTELPVKVTTK